MKTEQAITYFEDAVCESDEIIADCSPALQVELTEQKAHFVVALAALREKQERENPKPLTLDELRERVDKPVWESWTKVWRIVTMAHDGETVSLYNAYNTISAKSVIYNDGGIYDRPAEGEYQ